MFGKEKKPGLFGRLKMKIEKMFDAEGLTYFGKIFMFDIYLMIVSIFGIGIVSIIKTIIKAIYVYVEQAYAMNMSSAKILPGIGGTFIALFIVSLVAFLIMSVIEGCCEGGEEGSLMEKKNEDK